MLGRLRHTTLRAVVSTLALSLVGAVGALGTTSTVTAAAAAPAAAVTSVAAVPGAYTPVTPHRILDTRRVGGVSGTPPLAAGRSVVVTAGAAAGLPTSGVGAVAVTVTATSGSVSGYLSTFAYGAADPGTSTVNWAAGQTIANAAVVRVSPAGQLVVRNASVGTVHVVVDVTGYYTAGTATAAGALSPLTPARILDTRRRIGVPGVAPLGDRASVRVALAPKLPGGAAAVLVNLTSTGSTTSGYVTNAPPAVGTALNWRKGQTVANLVVVPVAPDGSITLVVRTAGGTTHLVADLVGATRPGPLSQAGTLSSTTTSRLRDTRQSVPRGAGPQQDLVVPVGDVVRATPGGITAAVVNIAVAGATGSGYVTAWAHGTPFPSTSSVNFSAGDSVSGAVIVPVGSDNAITVRNVSGARIDVVVDLEAVVTGRTVVDAAGWTSAQVPGSLPTPTSLAGVDDLDCVDGPVCAALTTATTIAGGTVTTGTSVRRWDGTTWGAPAALSAFSPQLSSAVRCSTSGLCVAAVAGPTASQVASSGRTGGWTVQAPPADAGRVARVSGADCGTGTTCVVVGSSSATGTPSRPYAALDDGTGWRTIPLPDATPSSYLRRVACATDTSCVAIGTVTSGAAGPGAFLATWDGTGWTTQTVSVPGATSPSAVDVAVGGEGGEYTLTGVGAGPGGAFSAVRSAGAWTVSATRTTGDWGHELTCQTVGSACWAGRSGTLTSVPGMAPVTVTSSDAGGQAGGLTSLSCPGAWCQGSAQMLTGPQTDRGVVLEQTGGTWTSAAAPVPADATEGGLVAGSSPSTSRVSCWSTGCLLVGPYFSRTGGQPLRADVRLRTS